MTNGSVWVKHLPVNAKSKVFDQLPHLRVDFISNNIHELIVPLFPVEKKQNKTTACVKPFHL